MTIALLAAWSLVWKTTLLALLVGLVRREHLRGTKSIQTFLSLLPLLLVASATLPIARVPIPGLVLLSPPGALRAFVIGTVGVVAMLLLARIAIDLKRLAIVTRAGVVVDAGPWREALDSLASASVRGRDVPLIAAAVDVPLTWGWRRPVIVIPATLAEGAPLVGVLRHELEHVARRDWPKLVAVRIAIAFFFWLPATWFLARWLESESEAACDAAVVDGGMPPEEYGREVLECVRRGGVPALAAALTARRSLVAERLFVILGRVPSGRPRVVMILGLVFVAILIAPLRFGAPALVVPSPAVGESPREAAIRELRLLGDPDLESLVTAMEARDYSLRRRAPGTLDSPSALGPLALATYDRDPEVRRVAVWALGEMRYPTSLPVILPRLDDVSPAVRAEACLALADIPFVPVTTQLVLRLDDGDAVVRRAAAHALGDRRDPLARAPLRSRLLDPDRSVRDTAGWALDQL